MKTRFSIITPVYNPTVEHLELTIASVRNQTFVDWEWIVADDASPNPEVRECLRRAAATDGRIIVVERKANGHIVKASNDALNLAQGEWIVLLDHDDLLDKRALETVDQAIAANPGVGYLYTDEDKVDDEGARSGAFLKPEWSPERLRHQMYTGHLSVLRSDLVTHVGGFHEGFEGSQDHDLVLRVTELAESVVHIPEILYHWRIVPGSTAGDSTAKDYATPAGIRAVAEHLKRIGRPDDVVTRTSVAHTYRTIRSFDPDTTVSVVIPTRGSSGIVWGEKRVFVLEAVRSLLRHTRHSRVEIVVVYDLPTPAGLLEELEKLCGARLVLVPFDAPFNFSEKCNRGFLAASGEVVVFLNDDIEIGSDDFLEQLCAPLEEASVGLTGVRLLYPDGTLQHAGHAYFGQHLRHAYLGSLDSDPGYFGDLVVDREVSGLTAACVAVRRDVFDEVGGFWQSLPSNFNDVDFSRKIRSAGYRLIWLADVRATHFESRTRVNTVHDWEASLIFGRWQNEPRDPYLAFLGDVDA